MTCCCGGSDCSLAVCEPFCTGMFSRAIVSIKFAVVDTAKTVRKATNLVVT